MTRFVVLNVDETERWRDELSAVGNVDLSATPAYCRAFQENGDGEALCVIFEDDVGKVVYPVFRRSLTDLPFADNMQGSDLATPYGYGGIYLVCAAADQAELMGRFRGRMKEFAADTDIVSEFIRFHPLLGNNTPCEGLFDTIRHHNDNVIIDLTRSTDDMLAQCRERFRTGIRQSERFGCKIDKAEPSAELDEFFKLYRCAMRRRGNTGYLNFKHQLFSDLFDYLAGNIEMFVVRANGELIAGAIVLKSNGTLDYFLAANKRTESLKYANHFLVFEIAKWGKAHGFNFFHLGGGAESIKFFKSGFSKTTIPYFVGNHIFDRKRYDMLVAHGQRRGMIPRDLPALFFPAYRAYKSPSADRSLLEVLAELD